VCSCALSVYLSRRFPGTIISGRLFDVGSLRMTLDLPLLWFLPISVLGMALIQIYDVRYVVDTRGIETKVGILGLNQKIVRVRYEDIRSVEVVQTLWDRFLNIGQVEIGTAATGAVEVVLSGVAAPHEIQQMIQNERDRRQRLSVVEAVDSLERVNG
jgi:uncharacterized membrane protein YdbT with pleckstrin-like domain